MRNPHCTACPLHADASTVCLWGHAARGDAGAEIMIIGEAPGKEEDEQGIPFVGRAGQLLDELLAQAGIDRDSVYTTNAAKCRPPANRNPTAGEIAKCRIYLEEEVNTVRPRFILLMGNAALKSFTGESGITAQRGRPSTHNNIIVMPTLHPASIFYTPANRAIVEQDLRYFRGLMRKGFIPPAAPVIRPQLVDTPARVNEMLAALTGVISLDLETGPRDGITDKGERKRAGLYPWLGQITAVGFGTADTQYALLVNHRDSPWSRDDIDDILARAAARLERCYVVAQNGKFDQLYLKVHHGINLDLSFDSMLAHYLLDENQFHDLEYIARLYFNAPTWDISLEDKQGKATDIELAGYLAHDLYYTRQAFFALNEQLARDPQLYRLYHHLLMPLANLFVRIEAHGAYIDYTRLSDAKHFLNGEIDHAQAALRVYADINWSSPIQVAQVLYKKLRLRAPKLTPKGAPSTDESSLNQIDHPVAGAIKRLRAARQEYGLFIKGWEPYLVPSRPNGWRLHPTFRLSGTTTGRASCLRSGTQIMVPGGTKAIEDVRLGDLVYSYDDDLNLCLRPVTWAGCTGHKPCYRLHWIGRGGHHCGYLDATAEHRIRLLDGSYVRVDELRGGKRVRSRGQLTYHGGEHVLALHRELTVRDRNRLHATDHPALLENRFVFEQTNDWLPEHVHHENENRNDDRPRNLVGLTASAHTSIHAKQPKGRLSKKALKAIRKNAAKGRRAFLKKTVKRFTKAQVRRALVEGGGMVPAAKMLGCDYSSIRSRVDQWGWSQYRNNHMIRYVEAVGSHPVYDLTVAGTHNFIANEICVHNCEHPNLMQTTREPRVRSLITAPTGWELWEADLSQIELRLIAEASQDPTMMETFRLGRDIHWTTALREIERGVGHVSLVLSTASTLAQRPIKDYGKAIAILLDAGPDAAAEIDKKWKDIRHGAKAVNFGYSFSMWWKRFKLYARDTYGLEITDLQAQQSRIAFFQLYSRLNDWHELQKRLARLQGHVRSLCGQKRRLPDAQSPYDTPEKQEAYRQAINSPIQCFAAKINWMTLLQLSEEFPWTVFRPIATVHDAILAEVRSDHVERISTRYLEIVKHPALFDTLEIDLSVPLDGEVKIGPWGSGISVSKWLVAQRAAAHENHRSQDKGEARQDTAAARHPVRARVVSRVPAQAINGSGLRLARPGR